MIQEYIFKTVISFISLNVVIYLTNDNWQKLNPKHNGFIKRNFNRLCFCLIPVIRLVWVVLILILGIALGNDDFVDECKKRNKK